MKVAHVTAEFIARSAIRRMMITACFGAFEFSKNLVQSRTTNTALAFRRHNDLSFFVFFGNVSFCFEVFEEISNPVLVISEVILSIQLAHPRHGLRYVAGGHQQELLKNIQQFIKLIFTGLFTGFEI